jgi:hypothetical protein
MLGARGHQHRAADRGLRSRALNARMEQKSQFRVAGEKIGRDLMDHPNGPGVTFRLGCAFADGVDLGVIGGAAPKRNCGW